MTLANKVRLVPGQFHVLSLLRMAWKHKVLLLATTLVLTGAAGAIIYRLPNVYQADAVILVDSQRIPEKFVASTVEQNLQDNLNAISQQVLSLDQLQTIIDDLGLYRKERQTQTPQEIFNRMRYKDLDIELERSFTGTRSGAFRISYDGENPQTVAAVVNRVADLFTRANLRNREERAAGTSEFLEERLRDAKKSLDQQEATLSQYKMRFTGELPQQEGALEGALNRLQAELQANEDAINRAQQNKLLLQNTLQLAESSLQATVRALAAPRPTRVVPNRDAVAQAPAAGPAGPRPSDTIRAELATARVRYLDDFPEVKRLKAALDEALEEEAKADAAEAQRVARMKTATPPSRVEAVEVPAAVGTLPTQADLDRDRERVSTTKTQIELLDREIATRNGNRQGIEKEIQSYQARVESLPLREQQMAALSRDYDTSKANYRSLLDKKMSADMASEMEREQQSERFTVADPAHVPLKPVKPSRLLYSGVSAVLALALSILFVLAIELKKDVLLGEWELPTGIPVLGRIAFMPPPAATHGGEMRAGALGLILLIGAASIIPIVHAWVARGVTHV